jgi:hypothetical protein
MSTKNWSARTRRELIIEVWEALDCESVGARELEEIQQALQAKFGVGALESPAAIARAVAEEGAVLRHPEVFDCDVKWRKQRMEKTRFGDGLDFSDLSSAFESVVKIEEARMKIQTAGKGQGERVTSVNNKAAESKILRDTVIAAREELLLRGRSKILDDGQRRQAKEISEWLRIWLQSPELFSDWLDLRRRSPEYREKFPEEKVVSH